MGGLGSGNRNRLRGDTLEDHRRIDVCRFKKEGMLTPGWIGAWEWKSTSGNSNLINVYGGTDQIELSYRYTHGEEEWQSVRQVIRLLRVDRHLGGQQVYFECPACARRVRFLYGAGKEFRCQTCHDLIHASSREGVFDRQCRKIRKLRKKLHADTMMEAPMPRPKGMHQKTYMRLFDEIIARETAALDEIEHRVLGFRRSTRSLRKSGGFWT